MIINIKCKNNTVAMNERIFTLLLYIEKLCFYVQDKLIGGVSCRKEEENSTSPERKDYPKNLVEKS